MLWFSNRVMAIEAACGLIDDGYCVSSVGLRSTGETISENQIVRVHALWARAKLVSKRASTSKDPPPSPANPARRENALSCGASGALMALSRPPSNSLAS